MARYTGPTTKIARKFGEAIFGYDKVLEKRNFPPGQHGVTRKRKKVSEFGLQLKEKQKAKHTYGLLERQFRRFFDIAHRKSGPTGEILLQLLESRLDNVVFRMGFAPTRRAARQMVSHKHIKLNGFICNIPSTILKPGDKISPREKSSDLDIIAQAVAKRNKKYSWLELDTATMTGTFIAVPQRTDIPENINEQLIVELYSK